MPRGIPKDGLHWTQRQTTKADLLQRKKEFLADIDARIKGIERREKALKELKPWLARRNLGYTDLGWMFRQLAPQKATVAVKSKKPLQPPKNGFIQNGKLVAPKGDPEFRRAIREARLKMGLSAIKLGKKIKVNGSTIASWEIGRFVPLEDMRARIVKFLGLPAGLGAEASAAMGQTRGVAGGRASAIARRANGQG